MPTLAELPLQMPGGTSRTFFYRPESIGDKGVIQQIFQASDYVIVPDARFQTLIRYANAQIGAGRRPLIVDAGANIGASAVFFSLQYPSSRIVAIEPEKHNAELLRRNCEGLDVLVHEAALGAEAGAAFLSDPGESDWGFRVGTSGETPVPMMTVPDIIDAPEMAEFFPLICKIDIEGGEAGLFSKNTGWFDRFALVIIELHDWLLPGQANSRNFLRTICDNDFDFTYRGENAFCFNNRLLRNV
jgi:FkbM family methyltransferase